MAEQWQPANELEKELMAYVTARDLDGFVRRLATAELLLPCSERVAAGQDPFTFLTDERDGVSYVFAFTSPSAMVAMLGLRFRHYQPAPLRDLAAAWPDPSLRMVIDPSGPLEFEMYAAHLIRIAGWEMVDQCTSAVDDGVGSGTTLSKFLSAVDVARYIDQGHNRVSGYVHRMDELEYFDRPERIVPAFSLDYPGSPFSADDDAIFQVCWPAYGGETLYRPAYGGNTVEQAAIVEGAIVDDPPFRGTGFVLTAQGAVDQFKVTDVTIPHGAQLLGMKSDGTRYLVAIYNADSRNWQVLMTESAARELDARLAAEAGIATDDDIEPTTTVDEFAPGGRFAAPPAAVASILTGRTAPTEGEDGAAAEAGEGVIQGRQASGADGVPADQNKTDDSSGGRSR